MANLRIGIIGCGAIARFHVPAFKEAGLQLAAVSGSPGSSRVTEFAQEFGIPGVYRDPLDLIAQENEFDGILLCVPVPPTLELLQRVMDTGIPVLVEKPVTYGSEALRPFIGSNLPVMVGYNRRFYASTARARREVADGEQLLVQLIVPDAVTAPTESSNDRSYLTTFFSNSVHGLDLVRHVVGDLSVSHVERTHNAAGNLTGLAALLRSDSGAVVQFTANWGAPANFSLTLDRPGRRYDMKPFESATVYEGMDVAEPTSEMPIRTYQPKAIDRVPPLPEDVLFKPGFVGQARAFAELIQGRDASPAASLTDAYAALRLAEELVGMTLLVE